MIKKIDFFVKTALPPVEGVFYEGQIFDAYVFVSDLLRRSKHEIILMKISAYLPPAPRSPSNG